MKRIAARFQLHQEAPLIQLNGERGWVIPALLLVVLVVCQAAQAVPQSVTVNYQTIMGFGVKYVAVNMNDPDVVVTTATATRFPYGLEAWSSMINRLHPDAAINGTYFCTHSFMPVGDVAVNGSLLYKGVVGTGLCITVDNRVAFLPGPRQAQPNWNGFSSVLCAGPRLLNNGKFAVNARAEGFRDPNVLGSAARSAVAWRPDGMLLLLTIEQRISLKNLAFLCQHLGATEAMTLDGGSSSGLYADGRTLTRPARGLSTALVVYSTRERFNLLADRLFPAKLSVLAKLDSMPPAMIASTWNRTVAPASLTTSTPVTPTVSRPPEKAPIGPPTLVRLVQPSTTEPIKGMVPVRIEVDKDARLSWVSVRINDRLRAMGNTWPLVFNWDSTKEEDGTYTLEVTGWSDSREVLARQIHKLRVQNSLQVAGSN